MSKAYFIAVFSLFYLVWALGVMVPLEVNNTKYPNLRARLGTVLHHSKDNTAPQTLVYHNYCYYPKPAADSKVGLKRVDSGDCSNWYGQVLLPEAYWVSEREKYWWSENQYTADCPTCTDKLTSIKSLLF